LLYNILDAKHHVTFIWASGALSCDETVYDAHIGRFRALVALAAEALPVGTHEGSGSRAKFSFEMGFLPLLSFVALKCRHLRTRVAALRNIRALTAPRENLWDAEVMVSIGNRAIELEHGRRFVQAVNDEAVAQDDLESGTDWAARGGLRVMDWVVDKDTRITVGEDGIKRRDILYILPSAKQGVIVVRETVEIGKWI
jgi:hypothetical protein